MLHGKACQFGIVQLKSGLTDYIEFLQIDDTEEERCENESFHRLSDVKATPVSQAFSSRLRTLVNSTTKRIPSKRPQISDVSAMITCTLYIYLLYILHAGTYYISIPSRRNL